MSFTLKLPSDVSATAGASEIKVDAKTYAEALWKLVETRPAVRSLLVNSSDQLRSTIRCTIKDRILNEDTVIPDGSIVNVFFIRAGG